MNHQTISKSIPRKSSKVVAHNAKKGHGIDATQLLSYYTTSYTLGYIIPACGEVFKRGIRIGGSLKTHDKVCRAVFPLAPRTTKQSRKREKDVLIGIQRPKIRIYVVMMMS